MVGVSRSCFTGERGFLSGFFSIFSLFGRENKDFYCLGKDFPIESGLSWKDRHEVSIESETLRI